MADLPHPAAPHPAAPLLDLRVPLTVRHKETRRTLLSVPPSEATRRARETVEYEGEELVLPHLCYETVEHADLSGADLRGLFLYNAVFAHVRLAGADFTGAHLRDTAFLDCPDLDRAVGLDQVEHDGPSCLDRRTLSACVASLPDVFLAGVGYLPDEAKGLRALYPGTLYPAPGSGALSSGQRSVSQDGVDRAGTP